MKYLAFFIFVLLFSCTDKSTDSRNDKTSIPDNILPLKIGNEWTYYKYSPSNITSKTSYSFKCIKDTMINYEIWFVFEFIHNDSVSILGDWGPAPAVGSYRYYTNRPDGVYWGGFDNDSLFKQFILFPKDGQKHKVMDAYVYFKTKIQIQTSMQVFETYQFIFELGDKPNAIISYLAPGIGLVFSESSDDINSNVIKGVYNLKDCTIK